MDKRDLMAAWERLRKVYDNLPKADADILAEWLPPLSSFSADVLNMAVSDYIAREKFKPNPARLRDYCFKALETKRKQQFEAQANEPDKICPYCNNQRWFKAKDFRYTGNAINPWEDAYLPCGCKDWTGVKGNRGQIKECLTDALADPAWVFDASQMAFVRRDGWIGDTPPDTRPVKDADYEKLMNDAGNLFNEF